MAELSGESLRGPPIRPDTGVPARVERVRLTPELFRGADGVDEADARPGVRDGDGAWLVGSRPAAGSFFEAVVDMATDCYSRSLYLAAVQENRLTTVPNF